jgi:hypothetical protein
MDWISLNVSAELYFKHFIEHFRIELRLIRVIIYERKIGRGLQLEMAGS